MSPPTRAELVAETAITLLARGGMRGLTHRAVDEAAGLPPGSTSNIARTRAALLELTLARLTDLERVRLGGFQDALGAAPPGRAELTEGIARLLHSQLTQDRRRTIARYELALEATRRPELRAVYDDVGRGYRAAGTALVAAAGSADPERHGPALVAFVDGMVFDAVVGAGAEPGLDDLRRTVAEYLSGILPPA